jgi:hypothetical protein
MSKHGKGCWKMAVRMKNGRSTTMEAYTLHAAKGASDMLLHQEQRRVTSVGIRKCGSTKTEYRCKRVGKKTVCSRVGAKKKATKKISGLGARR